MRKPVLFLLLLGAVAAPAQEAHWYQIELIAFARNAPNAGATEYWPEDPGSPSVTQARSLLDSGADIDAYSRLPRSELSLDTLYGDLLASRGQLEPLLYLGWRQPLAGEREAVPVYLGTDPGRSGAPRRLEGTITVSGDRYLYAELDLLLTRLEQSITRGDAGSGNDASRGPVYHLYRLRDRRMMRRGELHYIDHPMIGVLLLVKPLGFPDSADEGESSRNEQGIAAPPADD